MLTQTGEHMAVHLQDYYPEIYGAKHPKEFKEKSLELYPKLKLNLFEDDLKSFLNHITKQAEGRAPLQFRRESI